jgi:glycosyltransferase involved in cell wall biosynthesis
MTGSSLLVDLQVTQVNRERGIPRYAQSLVLALARERPSLEIACLIDPDRDPPLFIDQLASNCRILEGTGSIRGLDRSITHFLQCGLFEGHKRVSTLFPVELAAHRPRLGAILYDLIPWLFPEAYLSDPRMSRDYLRVLPALPRLDRLFTISESVRRDVIAIANVEPSRVTTINGGLDGTRWGARATTGGDRGLAGAPLRIRNDRNEPFEISPPYWLYVGGDDFRKNLPRLIEALGILKAGGHFNAPVVVACSIEPTRRNDYLRAAEALGLRPGSDIVFTGFVSDETLGSLLAHCMASLFPSLYEGLGLPVLESYAFGKPVLASDTSAFREIVPERCRFDPYRAASIADAMRRFWDDPTISEESLAFAPQAIAMAQWAGAARRLAEWLDEEVSPHPAPAARPLWVATSLPPDKSGVAVVTQRSLAAPNMPVVFFAPMRSAREIEAGRRSLARVRHSVQREPAPVEVLSLRTLPLARHAAPGQPVVFVLGNSEHHVQTLAHLFTFGANQSDAVYLHDVHLSRVVTDLARSGQYRGKDPYDVPAEALREDWRSPDGADGLDTPNGPRLLVRRARVRHFIVNSTAAADLLRRHLGGDADGVRIDVLFLPVLPATVRPSTRELGRLRIGHFGNLGPRKQPELLLAACDILARRHPIELVFAGYAVRPYVLQHGLERKYLRLIESPSDEELEEIMGEVDCAVQLRHPDVGESSGVVNQLIALRRPVICTRTGSFLEMREAVSLVGPDVSPEDLAETIERAIAGDSVAAMDAFAASHSPWVFEARLRELLELDTARRSP